MNSKQLVQRVKTFGVKHSGKIAAATVAVTAMVGSAMADIATEMANGTAVVQAGIAVTQTPPLGYIVDGFAVGIGALIFVRIVRRLA